MQEITLKKQIKFVKDILNNDNWLDIDNNKHRAILSTLLKAEKNDKIITDLEIFISEILCYVTNNQMSRPYDVQQVKAVIDDCINKQIGEELIEILQRDNDIIHANSVKLLIRVDKLTNELKQKQGKCRWIAEVGCYDNSGEEFTKYRGCEGQTVHDLWKDKHKYCYKCGKPIEWAEENK